MMARVQHDKRAWFMWHAGGDAAVLPLFDCSSSAPSPLIAGMLTRCRVYNIHKAYGHVSYCRLLAGEDPLPHAFTGACIQLCRYPTVFSSSFSSHSSLLLLLKSLNSLDDLLTSGNTPREVIFCSCDSHMILGLSPAEKVREEVEECVEWLHCLEVYCYRCFSALSVSLGSRVNCSGKKIDG